MVLTSSKGHLDPSYIVRLMLFHGITQFMFSVPTMVRSISPLDKLRELQILCSNILLFCTTFREISVYIILLL